MKKILLFSLLIIGHVTYPLSQIQQSALGWGAGTIGVLAISYAKTKTVTAFEKKLKEHTAIGQQINQHFVAALKKQQPNAQQVPGQRIQLDQDTQRTLIPLLEEYRKIQSEIQALKSWHELLNIGNQFSWCMLHGGMQEFQYLRNQSYNAQYTPDKNDPIKDSWHTILGVSPNASEAEVRTAYKRKAMQYHPDKNPGNAAAEEEFKKAANAHTYWAHSVKKS